MNTLLLAAVLTFGVLGSAGTAEAMPEELCFKTLFEDIANSG